MARTHLTLLCGAALVVALLGIGCETAGTARSMEDVGRCLETTPAVTLMAPPQRSITGGLLGTESVLYGSPYEAFHLATDPFNPPYSLQIARYTEADPLMTPAQVLQPLAVRLQGLGIPERVQSLEIGGKPAASIADPGGMFPARTIAFTAQGDVVIIETPLDYRNPDQLPILEHVVGCFDGSM